MVAVSVDVNVFAVIVNEAVLAPAETVAEAGTVRFDELFVRVTAAPPDGAVSEIVTAQEVLAFGASVEATQFSEDTVAGADREIDALADEAFSVAVSVAD